MLGVVHAFARPDAVGLQEQDAHEDEDAAFGRMLATHNENVQSGARPLDGSEDSFAGKQR